MITELSSYRRQIGCHHNRQLLTSNIHRNSAARNDETTARTVPSRCMPLLITGLLLTSQIAQALAAPPTVARGQHGPPSRGAGALRNLRQTAAAHSPSKSYAPAAPALGVGYASESPVFPSRSDRNSVLAGLDLFSHPGEAQAPPARAAARKKRQMIASPIKFSVSSYEDSGRLNLTAPASQSRGISQGRPMGGEVASPSAAPNSLAQAAKEGDLVSVIAALCAGSAVDQLDENNYTPLQLAIINGHTLVAEYLIGQNASVAVVTQNEYRTVLHLAVRTGLFSMTNLLAQDAPEIINKKDIFGWTPLMYAAQGSDPILCEMLLRVEGIDVNLTNIFHQTALRIATAHGSNEVFDRLLQSQDVDVNIADYNGNTALMECVRQDKNYRLNQLLNNTNIDINRQNNEHKTALMLAIEHNNTRMFDSLLAADGQDLSLHGWCGETALHKAVKLAVKSGNLSYVQELMAKSTDEINATDYDNNTPLHIAAYADEPAIVEQLLTATNINVMLKNRHGKDALHWATNSTRAVRVLEDYMTQHQLGPINVGAD
ncbi:ankyrin repeat domain-containing protein [Sodalis endosymbiont of Spalangia cameroni]|uniref:ankyrin repeat domain-containing protein n=1 Tax=Sodalis praecaptivus TaxID=1239307 RepID=UPI0031F72E66